MNGTIDDKLESEVNLEDGKALYTLATEKFGEEFTNTRILADWVLKILNATPSTTPRKVTIERIEAFFKKLSQEDATEISNLKGSRGGDTKEALVNKRLDELFQTEAQ